MDFGTIGIGGGQVGVPLATRRAYGVLFAVLVELALAAACSLPARARAGEPRVREVGCVGMTVVLEVIWFPAGKGAPRWQERPRGALFLGIDHTAIVVADTEASLRLYRDVLGLAVAGESDNHGDEQAHLNGVEGAHLRITTLRAARGPGVELLEYLEPAGGRPFPADARPNDLLHWQTTLLVIALDEAGRAVLGAGATLASRAPAELAGSRLGLLRAQLVRDPDGHALLLAESPPALARPGSR